MGGAAIFIPYGTAYSALFQCTSAKPNESVLIHGASGGVGIAAIQFAKARGLKVFGTASSKEGLSIIEKFGAIPFNHREEGYQEKIIEATDGKGVDIILEMLSNVNLENDITKLLGYRGRIIIIGCRGKVEINPRALMGKNGTITG